MEASSIFSAFDISGTLAGLTTEITGMVADAVPALIGVAVVYLGFNVGMKTFKKVTNKVG